MLITSSQVLATYSTEPHEALGALGRCFQDGLEIVAGFRPSLHPNKGIMPSQSYD